MKKTLFLLAALAFATAGTSFAQTAPVKATGTDARQTARHYQKGPKDPAKMADHRAGKMAKELGLNADQEAKVERLMLDRQQETTALKAKYATNRKAGRTEMKAAHDRFEAQFKTILTPDQYAKYQAKKEEHRDKMKDGKMKMKAKS
ncbi:hypothetical protein [Hymenobacter sp. UYCo722]|uniref:hypothetical protein n=1 Tax=Hymenobacter sp. UYCo722 TaxID=3156335 RepID=UPI003394236A